MKLPRRRYVIISSLLVAAVGLCIFVSRKTPHQIETSLGIQPVEDISDSSMHFKKRAITFTKSTQTSDLYDQLWHIVSDLYSPPKFYTNPESKQTIEVELINESYKHGLSRFRRIDSSDSYSSIWVIDYQNHVTVFLIDRY